MSCDESVMRDTNEDIRGSYSTALLSLSAKQSGLLMPLAFGESNVKSRIKNILNYKKPAFWVIAAAVVVVAFVLIGLVTNPKDKARILTPAEQFLKYKTEYVGDASKVSYIIRSLNFPERVNYDYLELHTESTPYAVTVNLKTDTETREYYAELPHQAAFEKNAIIMFSLIGNVDSVDFKLTDDRNDYLMQYTRDWANDYMGRDVRQFAQSEEEFARFLGMLDYSSSDVGGADNRISSLSIRQETKLPDFVYDGSDHIEKLVYDTEVMQHSDPRHG